MFNERVVKVLSDTLQHVNDPLTRIGAADGRIEVKMSRCEPRICVCGDWGRPATPIDTLMLMVYSDTSVVVKTYYSYLLSVNT
jgi:hypothetical protein